MCGITGIKAFNEVGRMHMIHLAAATQSLSHRGPDHQDTYIEDFVGLGHRRLSVIDVSNRGHQPMTDSSGRFVIVYNGELYNYRELRQQLQQNGVAFKSDSDTEVVLQSYIHQGIDCLQHFNGCFSFAVYDQQKQTLFIARDRMGIKPLWYYQDEDKFIFASELKSLLTYNLPKEIDAVSLTQYLQLTYVPAPYTMLQGVRKLLPGHYLLVSPEASSTQAYYQIPNPRHGLNQLDYQAQKDQLVDLLDQSVQRRLVSDVPLGAFLSGGIDSSVIVALASRHVEDFYTFSIGFEDQPFFDETHYAQQVADHFKTKHTVFKLTNNDLFRYVQEVWDHLDEPFADSSAIATYILSKYTRDQVTVALSGDGADELLAGYRKHVALQAAMSGGFYPAAARLLAPLSALFAQGRHGSFANKMRQIKRFNEGLSLPKADRYWLWASIYSQKQATGLLSESMREQVNQEQLAYRQAVFTRSMNGATDINEFLYADMQLVLPNDMLTKVDLMSMAHGLEVRVPFLDHEVVEYAFSLPAESKLKGSFRKRILQDAFKDILPATLYNRPKARF